MRIAETIQAAESVAEIPRRIPGALRHPKIAISPQNVTAARIIRFACIIFQYEMRGLGGMESVTESSHGSRG